LKRVVVIADTHLPRGGRELSRDCVQVLDSADLILHAGDVTAVDVLERLRRLAPLHAVQGNMDDPELRRALPRRLTVEVEGLTIGMVHVPGPADGRAERLAGAFPGCDVVVYGHTHVPELTRHRDTWIVNPGSPTERRRAPHRSLVVLEVDDRSSSPQLVVLP
jgi:putative phosphoesterase